jgi:hypothetical protein
MPRPMGPKSAQSATRLWPRRFCVRSVEPAEQTIRRPIPAVRSAATTSCVELSCYRCAELAHGIDRSLPVEENGHHAVLDHTRASADVSSHSDRVTRAGVGKELVELRNGATILNKHLSPASPWEAARPWPFTSLRLLQETGHGSARRGPAATVGVPAGRPRGTQTVIRESARREHRGRFRKPGQPPGD